MKPVILILTAAALATAQPQQQQGVVFQRVFQATTAAATSPNLRNQGQLMHVVTAFFAAENLTRRNLLNHSNDFTVSPTWTTGPNMSFDGTKITADNELGAIRQTIAVAASTTYTLSFDVRANDGPEPTPTGTRLTIGDTAGGYITTQVMYEPTAEWQRITHTFTTGPKTTGAHISLLRYMYTTGVMHIRNAQVELGATATAYQDITTEVVPSPVTGLRLRIEASYDNTHWFSIAREMTTAPNVGSQTYNVMLAYGAFPFLRIRSLTAPNRAMTVWYSGQPRAVTTYVQQESDRIIL